MRGDIFNGEQVFATRKAQYFIGMGETGKAFFETLKTLGRKYFADVADATPASHRYHEER